MKKTILISLIFLLGCANAFAAQMCVDFPDGDHARVRQGITKGGKACNDGEAQISCAKRLMANIIKDEIRNYEVQKAREAVSDPQTVNVN